MKIFIDTGSVAEVEEIAGWGVLSGATTNPSLLAKEDGDPGEIVVRICELVDGPVSAEVVSSDASGMLAEGRALAGLHRHIVVKVPFSAAGLSATRDLTADGIRVNMTLVFSAAQAVLAAEAGATYVSCFMGRVDDISVDSTAVLAEIVETLSGSEAPGARRLPAPSDAHRHRRPPGVRGGDGAGQGASPDAPAPADHERDRALRGRLALSPRVRRLAGRARSRALARVTPPLNAP